MSKTDVITAYKIAYREVLIKDRKKGFKIHLLAYILTNILIVIVNLSTNPEVKWYLGSILGWGTGILSHFIFSVALAGKMIDKVEKEVDSLDLG